MAEIGKRTCFDLSPAAVAIVTKKTKGPDSEEETPLDKPVAETESTGRATGGGEPEKFAKPPAETHTGHVQALKRALSEMQSAIDAKYAVFFKEFDRVKERRKWVEESGKDLSNDDKMDLIWPRPPNGDDCELRDAVGVFGQLYEAKPPGRFTILRGRTTAFRSLMVTIGVVDDEMMNTTQESARSEIIKIIGASEFSAFRSRITRVPVSSIIHLSDGRIGVPIKLGVVAFVDNNHKMTSPHGERDCFVVNP